MENTTEIEHIKGAIYTAQTQHQAVLKGFTTYEEARKTVIKWMGFGLPEGEIYNLRKYFNNEVSGSGAIMKDVTLREQSKKEAWEALEYFDLI